MTDKELKRFVERLMVLYPSQKWTADKLIEWRDLLRDIPLEDAEKALDAYAKENHFPPSISDIRKGSRKHSTSKVRANDFVNGVLSELDLMLIEKQKQKCGTGEELRKWCEENGLKWGGK